MSLDVALSPAALRPGDAEGCTVVVIDVLRATTTMAVALANGAEAVLPATSTEEARRVAGRLPRDRVLLVGERGGLAIAGFDLGNSPREMAPDAVRGRILVMTTTNGTRALAATAGAAAVYLGAAVNLALVVEATLPRWLAGEDLRILCAGRDGEAGLDDAYAAGRLVEALLCRAGDPPPPALGDGAAIALSVARHFGDDWVTPLTASAAGRELVGLGLAPDIQVAATEDGFPVLLTYADGRITRGEAT